MKHFDFKNYPTDNVNILDSASVVKKHPYLVLGVLCVLFGFGFTQDVTPYMDVWLIAALFAAAVLWAGVYFKKTIVDFAFTGRGLLHILPLGVGVVVSGIAFRGGKNGIFAGGISTLVFILIAFILLKATKRLSVQNALLLVFSTGLLVRVIYALYTPIALESVRQHDVFPFMLWEGDSLMEEFVYKRHAEYIEYIARYLKLPDVDPRGGLTQLYHPPFHHLIAGLWLRLQKTLGVNYEQAIESIQLLTVFYSSSCMITGYKIFVELGMTGKKLLRATALISLFPWFFLFAGGVNNDMLSIALGFGAVLTTIRWYKNPKITNLLQVALTMGLAMFTKLSMGLPAPAIAFVFLERFISVCQKKNVVIKTQKGEKQASVLYMILGFSAFALIVFPLGLGWQVKNLVLYDMPLTYIPSLSKNTNQYVGGFSVLERMFGFNSESFTNPFVIWNDLHGTDFCEYNLFSGFLKTSLFGETTLFSLPAGDDIYKGILSVVGRGLCTALYVLAILLVVYFAVAFVKFIKNNCFGINKNIKTMLFLVFAIFIGNYIIFCFIYPFTCTMNFRYAVPCLLLLCPVIGFDKSEEKAKTSGERVYGLVTDLCVWGFLILSVAVYVLLALAPF